MANPKTQEAPVPEHEVEYETLTAEEYTRFSLNAVRELPTDGFIDALKTLDLGDDALHQLQHDLEIEHLPLSVRTRADVVPEFAEGQNDRLRDLTRRINAVSALRKSLSADG